MESQMRPRVYIPNKGGFDYSDCERFGKPVFITEGAVNPFDFDAFTTAAYEPLLYAIPQDLMMVTGLATQCAILSAMLADRFGHVHYLVYKKGQYVQRTVLYGGGRTWPTQDGWLPKLKEPQVKS